MTRGSREQKIFQGGKIYECRGRRASALILEIYFQEGFDKSIAGLYNDEYGFGC